VSGGGVATNRGLSLSSRRVPVSPLVAASARLTARLLPERQLIRLRRLMVQAGLPAERHFWLFLAAELIAALTLSALVIFVLRVRAPTLRVPMMAPLLVLLMAAIGFYLPFFWLRRRIARRRRLLLRALPDALDLMAIGVSAGLALDSAMLEVVEKWEGELSREFGQVLNEIRMGISRRQALLNLVERTQIEDIRLIVAALIQAEELGSNISETLAIQAEQLRIRRRQWAEEQARKAPVKMLIPLVFLIFPALFIVLLGPAGLSIIRMFRRLSLG
jgi:tight adherence protein C